MRNFRVPIVLMSIAVACLDFSARAATSNLTLNVIYSFTNGMSPNAGLIIDAQGNFHGTLATGGPNNLGGFYEVTHSGILTNLVFFDGNPNGAIPLAPLIEDQSGNFFGTTSSGGTTNSGTIFEISSSGQFLLLATFYNTNGANPQSPLVQGTNDLFYGATFSGGGDNLGSIYELSSSGVLSNIFSFGGSSGANPAAGLIEGIDGNLYGTTEVGGADGLGTVYQLTYTHTLNTLASFTEEVGAFPGQLVESSASNFFGAAINGGTNFAGTIFRLGPSNLLQNVFTFNITNGANPNSPLIIGKDGFLYGTTEEGGAFGMGTVFRMSQTGALANFISFDGANGALPRSGVIQGADGNFYGTTSQGGAYGYGEIYELTGFPPVITKPPANQRWITNGTVEFVVAAAGTEPLSYQWFFDGTNAISGATNTTLIVSHEELSAAGTYTVVVSNAYGSVTSSNALLSVPAPIVAIVPPPATVINAPLTLSGTSAGPASIATVLYQLNSNGWQTASGTTRWQANVTLQPGKNAFQAQSFDPVGTPSAIKSVTVFYIVNSPLTLRTNGLGSITTSFKGTNLILDRSYTAHATPGPGQLFLSWTGTLSSTENPLIFLMQSNMVIQANFVTNPFIAASGTYEGLFFNPDAIGEQSSGLLGSLRIQNSGAYSGVIVVKGGHYGFTGSFSVGNEESTANVARLNTQGGSLTVNMTLGSDEVSGTVSGTDEGGWTSALLAGRTGPFEGSAQYTMLLPPIVGSPSSSPPGYGYTLVTNHNGLVTLTGAVADGAAFSQIASVVGTGDVPFYASLYNNTGLLIGWLNMSGSLTATNLWWVKTSSKAVLYPSGFTNSITGIPTSAWTKPPAGYLTDGSLTMTDTSLALNFNVSITNTTLLKEPGSPTNSLTGIFNPRTGLLQITFGNGTGRATTLGYCAILGDSTNGGGYFVAKTNAGAITLAP